MEKESKNKRQTVYMIDYDCVVDDMGKPMGHVLGVTEMIYELIKDADCDIIYVCSPEYAKHMPNVKSMAILKSVVKSGTRYSEDEIVNNNLKTISRTIKNGILLFTHNSPYIVKNLPKNNKHRKSIGIFYNNLSDKIGTDGFIKKVLRKPYNRYRNSIINKRIYALIKTNNKLQFKNPNIFYMPDYYYSEAKHKRRKEVVSNKVVCLGENNRYKKILPLIEKFRGSKYKLVIRGKFLDNNVYEKALDMISGYDNIVIENNNLSRDDFYTELATAKFCILPYDTMSYYNRTTGIGIEAMFSDCIVIGPSEVLEFNGIKGIGYESIEELDLDMLDKDYPDVLADYKAKRENEYSKENMKKVINAALNLTMSALTSKN